MVRCFFKDLPAVGQALQHHSGLSLAVGPARNQRVAEGQLVPGAASAYQPNSFCLPIH